MKNYLFFIWCFGVVLLTFGCIGSDSGQSTPMSAAASAKYISSFYGGEMSTHQVYKIRFARAVDHQRSRDLCIRTDPRQDISLEWVSDQELILRPEVEWSGNTKITVDLVLGELFDDLAKDEFYRFSFFVFPPVVWVHDGKLRTRDEDSFDYQGVIEFGGFAHGKWPQVRVTASYNGQVREVELLQGEGYFDYSIQGIERGSMEGYLYLTFEGEGIEESKTTEVKIPSKGQFDILNFEKSVQSVLVYFSNPLMYPQDLKGLVVFNDQDADFMIRENVLEVFPKNRSLAEQVLKLFPGIQDVQGRTLKSLRSYETFWGAVRPAIEFTQGGKAILPVSSPARLRFKARGLQSILIKVEKIPEDNVLQHLQENRLDGAYELRRVGEVQAMDRVQLSMPQESMDDWNFFELDLSKYLVEAPRCMYNVTLGFDIEDVSLDCWTGKKEDLEYSDGLTLEEKYAQTPYYLHGFDWQERDNPCHEAYYTMGNWRSMMVMRSPFAITAKKGPNHHLDVFVYDIEHAQPETQSSVAVYNFQQRKLADAATNSEGHVAFDLEDNPFFLKVEKGRQVGYLPLHEGESLSLSPFDVDGMPWTKAGEGFIYAERGVWRPGDSIFVDFIWKKNLDANLDDQPVVARLIDPRGVVFSRKVGEHSTGKLYGFQFCTEESSPTGNWKIEIFAGGQKYSKSLRIEAIKPNRMAVALDFNGETVRWDRLAGKMRLDVHWLTGVPARNVRIELEESFRAQDLAVPAFPQYHFKKHSESWMSRPHVLGELTTDAEGQTTTPFDLQRVKKASSPVVWTLSGRAFEPSGDFSVFKKEVEVLPFSHYVGINTPNKESYMGLSIEKAHDFHFVVVDAKGKPIGGRKLKVRVMKLEWRWWWNRNETLTSYVTDRNAQWLWEDAVVSQDKSFTYTLPSSRLAQGRYLIQVEDLTSGHISDAVFYMYDANHWWESERAKDAPSIVQIILDKNRVEVGEKFNVKVPTEAGSRVFVTIESDHGIVQHASTTTNAEETELTFVANEQMIPNAYVHVAYIHPYASSREGRPIRSYAVEPIRVTNRDEELHPIIEAPGKVGIEETFEVSINEALGRTMEYTLAIVDEGLLSLTNYKTPDPNDVFLAKKALGIQTWDNYSYIMGAEDGSGNQVLTVGGDMETLGEGGRQERRFPPVVRHWGPFILKKGETAHHKVALPSYLGSIRIMVVAAGKQAFGAAEHSIYVREDLMVLGNAPRSLGTGERVRIPATVLTLDPQITKATVSLEVQGPIEGGGPLVQTVSLSGRKEATVLFEVKSKMEEGMADLRFKVRGGGIETEQIIHLPVITKAAPIKSFWDTMVAGGQSVPFYHKAEGMKGSHRVSFEVSRIPGLNLEKRLSNLLQYPYGCSEQRSSICFAQINLRQLMDMSVDEERQLRERIHWGLDELRKYQSSSGGIQYWPSTGAPDAWVSSYVGWVFEEARSRGYVVPLDVDQRLTRFLKQAADQWSLALDGDDEVSQAFRLYVLARKKMPQLGAMNRLKGRRDLKPLAAFLLAGSYALSGYEKTSVDIYRNIKIQDLGLASMRNLGSPLRNEAVICHLLYDLGEDEEGYKSALEIARRIGGGDYINTQESGWCLSAVARAFGQVTKGDEVNMSIKSRSEEVRLEGNATLHRWIPNHVEESERFLIKNDQKSPQYISVTSEMTPSAFSLHKARSQNLELSVKYSDMKGVPINEGEIHQGQTFIVETTIRKKNIGQWSRDEQLALNFTTPSGWEVIDTRWDVIERFPDQSPYQYMDVRDDRVLLYFDWGERQESKFFFVLNATHQGEFYQPPLIVESMYRDDFYARSASQRVSVIE